MSLVSPSTDNIDPPPAYHSTDRFIEDDDTPAPSLSPYSLESQEAASAPLVLTFEGEQIKKCTVLAPGGRTVFSTVSEGSTFEGCRVLEERLRDSQGNVVATFIRAAKGSDKIILGDKAPINRKSWMKPGMPFSRTLGHLSYHGAEYKWVSVKDPNQVTLELRAESNKTLLARYRDSRRDWSAPIPRVEIEKAKIEIYPPGLHMIKMILFSLLVVELVREDGAVGVMDGSTASGRGKMQGGYSARNF
ncbi:hypothetical protein SISSUDRAFT_1051507 [Sistotremastrum suecicum HHB10207 ss-3]|uniref:DUF6593 domain-containing protein n=1 Tax=Sistotremastrum suecicum HHB10207 ss-3 TaxID=1314776 RepID=A0A166AI25_9AGAM|nr:hypothetical protein SISSUDRAFT_1051507 [Sistotremastrum suecicum HHB10207 ss-3]